MVWTPWPVGRRLALLLGPIGLFGLLSAAIIDGGVVHRIALFPLAVCFGALLLLVPGAFVLTFVRLAGPFLAALVAISVSVPVALRSAEQSTSSTAGLHLLLLPYVASIAAILCALVDVAARRYQRASFLAALPPPSVPGG